MIPDDQLRLVNPAAIGVFLSQHGWKPMAGGPEGATVWTRTGASLDGQERRSVLVPDERSYDDYATRLRVLLNVLQEVHGLSDDAVYERLLEASTDVLYFYSYPSDSAIRPTRPVKAVQHEVAVQASEFAMLVDGSQRVLALRQGDKTYRVGETLWIRERAALGFSGVSVRKRVRQVLSWEDDLIGLLGEGTVILDLDPVPGSFCHRRERWPG